VPQLVPKEDLAPAVSANSVGFNISRAMGPALGGAIIAGFGIAAPFWLNAISNLGVVGALWWWRPSQSLRERLPAEGIGNAMVAGVRYARNNRHLRTTMIRAVAGIAGCCARVAIGHAAAPPRRVMNARRFIGFRPQAKGSTLAYRRASTALCITAKWAAD
jgi:MFS family permease